MKIFNRRQEQSSEVLDFLADASEVAAREMRRGPDSSPYRELDADAMDRQADRLRRRAAKARRKGA